MIVTPHDKHDRRPARLRRAGALAAAAVLLVGTAACSDSDDTADDADAGDDGASSQVDDLQAELDAANERADAAEAELAEISAELEELAGVDADRADEVIAAFAAVNEELALARAEIQQLTQRAETAEGRIAEIEEVAGQFPIQLDSSLIPDDMPGTYRIDFAEAYCEGLTSCGAPPQPTNATIYFTPEQFLRIGVDGILDAGLFALDGSLYGITDSLTALPPCGDIQRRARITITLYAGSISVLEDGTRVVNDLNASLTVDAPAEGPDCPAGLAFFASSLTPAG